MRPLRTLIIDHDPFTARLIETILDRQLGEALDLHHADDPTDAQRSIESRSFDLILLDIDASPIDGLKLLEAARRANAWTRIIALTGDADSEHLQRAFELGAAGHFLKPINPAALVALAEHYLDQHARWQRARSAARLSVAIVSDADEALTGQVF